eukprot:GEMP01008054.1.p1 GENE.GEMP01008054.1~~GEMP01008054.1.p1  ORF type:complete len:732 (+),score=127.13 GEMP01008054.1:649-2844(+)
MGLCFSSKASRQSRYRPKGDGIHPEDLASVIIRESKLAAVSDHKRRAHHILQAKQALKTARKKDPQNDDLAHLIAVVASLECRDVSCSASGSKGEELFLDTDELAPPRHLHERLGLSHLQLRDINEPPSHPDSSSASEGDQSPSQVSSHSSSSDNDILARAMAPLAQGYEVLDPDSMHLLRGDDDEVDTPVAVVASPQLPPLTKEHAHEVEIIMPKTQDNPQWLIEQCQALRRKLDEEKKERLKAEEKLMRAEDAASKLHETLKKITIGETEELTRVSHLIVSPPKAKVRAAVSRGGANARQFKPVTPPSGRCVAASHDGSSSSQKAQSAMDVNWSKVPMNDTMILPRGMEPSHSSDHYIQDSQLNRTMVEDGTDRSVRGPSVLQWAHTYRSHDENEAASKSFPSPSPIHYPGVTSSISRGGDDGDGASSILSSNSVAWGIRLQQAYKVPSMASLGTIGNQVPSMASVGTIGNQTVHSLSYPSPPASPVQPGLFDIRDLSAYRERRTTDLTVRVMNGVSEEEIAKFQLPKSCFTSTHAFFHQLDRLCQDHAGHPLSRVHWLRLSPSGTERRHADMRMLHELIHAPLAMPLYLSTVPMPMPAELVPFSPSIRLKSLVPAKIIFSGKTPSVPRVFLETTQLPRDNTYTIAFTDQWTSTTYIVEGFVAEEMCGVYFCIPNAMLQKEVRGGSGLYDVHLLVNGTHRSDNRRALAVTNSDRAMSSNASSTSFDPVD